MVPPALDFMAVFMLSMISVILPLSLSTYPHLGCDGSFTVSTLMNPAMVDNGSPPADLVDSMTFNMTSHIAISCVIPWTMMPYSMLDMAWSLIGMSSSLPFLIMASESTRFPDSSLSIPIEISASAENLPATASLPLTFFKDSAAAAKLFAMRMYLPSLSSDRSSVLLIMRA